MSNEQPGAPDFDSIWNEEGSAPQQPSAPQQQEDVEPGPPASTQQPPEGGENTGGAEAPAGGEEGGTNPPAGASDSEDDWIASLPEDAQERIRKELKDREDRFNALHGKLAPVQRRLSEAERRLAQFQRPPTQQPAQQPAKPPTQQQVADSMFDSDDWKTWEQDFPGDAKVVRRLFEAQRTEAQTAVNQLREQVESLTQRLGQTEQVVTRTVEEDEITKLEAKHSDWRELNESEEFWDWFYDDYRTRQPKSLRSLYYDDEKLREMFLDAEFTAGVLDTYKAEHATAAAPVQQAPAQEQQQSESTQPAQRESGKARLSMSVSPSVKGGSAPPKAVQFDGLSEVEKFDHIWNTMD